MSLHPKDEWCRCWRQLRGMAYSLSPSATATLTNRGYLWDHFVEEGRQHFLPSVNCFVTQTSSSWRRCSCVGIGLDTLVKKRGREIQIEGPLNFAVLRDTYGHIIFVVWMLKCLSASWTGTQAHCLSWNLHNHCNTVLELCRIDNSPLQF